MVKKRLSFINPPEEKFRSYSNTRTVLLSYSACMVTTVSYIHFMGIIFILVYEYKMKNHPGRNNFAVILIWLHIIPFHP